MMIGHDDKGGYQVDECNNDLRVAHGCCWSCIERDKSRGGTPVMVLKDCMAPPARRS